MNAVLAAGPNGKGTARSRSCSRGAHDDPPVYTVHTTGGSELWMGSIDPANEDMVVRFKTAMSGYNIFVTSPRDGTRGVVKRMTMPNLLKGITRNSIKPEITATVSPEVVVLRSGRTRGAAWSGVVPFYEQERSDFYYKMRLQPPHFRSTRPGSTEISGVSELLDQMKAHPDESEFEASGTSGIQTLDNSEAESDSTYRAASPHSSGGRQ